MDKAFIKGLRVVEALAHGDAPRGVTELAVELQLTKSNVHRLLGTLQAQGYVRQAGLLGGYELTPRLWELGCRAMDRFDLAQFARQAMQNLARATRETVHLSILDGLDVIYLDKIESEHDVRAYSRIGGRAPAWCVATGKAMLAYLPAQALAGIEPRLAPCTPNTLTSLAALQQELEEVRRSGHACNRGEWRVGVCGLAAVVFGASNEVVGAIGISGPAQRMTARQMRKHAGHVMDAADEVAQALGQRVAPPRLAVGLLRPARSPYPGVSP